MIVNRINEWLTNNNNGHDDPALIYNVEKLAGLTFKRQFCEVKESDKAGKLYLSHAGKCPRQVAFGYHGIEANGKEIDSRARLIFWAGDMVELTLTALIKACGIQIAGTGFNQIHLTLPLKEGLQATGYPDGLIIDAGDIVLLEVKSYSSFSFARFEKGDIDEAYQMQIQMYLNCLGLGRCVLLGMNKDNGVLAEKIVQRDNAIFDAGKDNLRLVADSTPESLPERKYVASDRGIMPWQCLYCAYWQTCLPDVEKVLVSNRYQLKIKNFKKEAKNGKVE